jgi:hypothetical protein
VGRRCRGLARLPTHGHRPHHHPDPVLTGRGITVGENGTETALDDSRSPRYRPRPVVPWFLDIGMSPESATPRDRTTGSTARRLRRARPGRRLPSSR